MIPAGSSVRLAGLGPRLHPQRRSPSITVTRLYPLGARDIALGLASPLAGRDDAVEAAADCVQKRLVAERAADQLASPQRGEGRVVRVRVEKIGETRRAVDERLHTHEPVVTASQMRA
jgi:hypothetical protein